MNKPWDIPAQQDDALAEEMQGGVEHSQIVIAGEKAARHIHELPEDWLRSRVRGWMDLSESPGLAWWIGTYTAEGRWIWASSMMDTYLPKVQRQDYAMRVCKHINRECNFGGAWLAGWFRGGKEFYLLWKDGDGDIHIPIEANKPLIALLKWTPHDWERQCCTAYGAWVEFKRKNEIRAKDTVKLAQGERTSDNHLRNAPA